MPKLVISANNQKLILISEYKDKDKAKKAGGWWDPSLRKWTYAFDLNVLDDLQKAFPNLEIDDDLQSLIRIKRYETNKLINFKREAIDNKEIDFSVDGLSFNGKNPLYNYQKHGVRTATYSDGGFLIGDMVGLGKTIQGLGISLFMKNKHGFKNCLIVCPCSVKYNWANEIKKFTKESFLVIDGSVEERYQKWFAPDVFYKIVNFEILARDLFYFGGFDRNGNPRDFRIPGYDQIIHGWYDQIICDEVHMIGGHKNQRTIALKSMETKYRLGLTGTPIDGSLTTFHSIMEWIKPGVFPSLGKFLDHYAEFDYWGGIKRFIHVNEFKDKIAPYYVRRLTKNVLTELPPVTHQNVFVELDDKSMKTYKKLARRKHPITQDEQMIVTVIRCRQFCDMPDILDLKDSPAKLDALESLLDDVVGEKENKVIVFTQYTEALKRIKDRLKSKYKICELDTGKNRFESCQLFNEGDYDIMLMTDAGSTGINLQSASYVINYDQNWSPAIMIQRYGRAWRNGQKNPVIVINLICKDTVEERVMDAIASKSKFSAEVLDEEVDEMSLGNVLSTKELFDLL